MILDYMTLKLIWFGIMAVILAAFAITGGMDIGAHILLPFVGRSDSERRAVLNAIGPTWEGNQVWLVVFGAGLFAVWPPVYATAFSSLYIALLIVVLMLILRPPGFDYRSKLTSAAWRKTWDICLYTSGIVLSLVFGVAIGNLFVGLPFHFNADLLPIYEGNFFQLFSPLCILIGINSLSMFVVQGAIFLQYKLSDQGLVRARQAMYLFAWIFVISFILAGLYINLYIPGYIIQSIPDLNTAFTASQKVVTTEIGAWINNYTNYHILWIFPIITLVAARIAVQLCKFGRIKVALGVNSISILCAVATAAGTLFPFILPSSSVYNDSLTIWDATASEKTLSITLIAVLVFLPFILSYTFWAYRVMSGKVNLSKDSY